MSALTDETIERVLKETSRDYSGRRVTAGLVVGTVRRKLADARAARTADKQPRLTFRHGPITITIEGLPDTVRPEAFQVDAIFYATFYDDEPAAYVGNFLALGGSGTFENIKPDNRFSARHDTQGRDEKGMLTAHRSSLCLHAPEKRPSEPVEVEAITRALALEAAAKTAAGEVQRVREDHPHGNGGYNETMTGPVR